MSFPWSYLIIGRKQHQHPTSSSAFSPSNFSSVLGMTILRLLFTACAMARLLSEASGLFSMLNQYGIIVE